MRNSHQVIRIILSGYNLVVALVVPFGFSVQTAVFPCDVAFVCLAALAAYGNLFSDIRRETLLVNPLRSVPISTKHVETGDAMRNGIEESQSSQEEGSRSQ